MFVVHFILLFIRSLYLAYRDSKLRNKILQCMILNGVIFVGSIAIYVLIIYKLVLSIAGYVVSIFVASGLQHSTAMAVVKTTSDCLFFSCWILPMYVLSTALNASWYTEISKLSVKAVADRFGSSQASAGVRTPTVSAPLKFADGIYRIVFQSVLMAGIYVLTIFPRVGNVAYLLYMSLLVSLVSFDQVLIGKGFVDTVSRSRLIESHLGYFLGFGIVPGFLCFSASYLAPFVETGFLAALMPYTISTAALSSLAIDVSQLSVSDSGITIFGWARRLSDSLINFISLITGSSGQ